MAYKIEYSPETAYRYPQRTCRQKRIRGNWVLVVLLLAGFFWVRFNGIPDFLIPGDKEITREAAALLVEDLQDGKTVKEAITVFCNTILDATAY